MINMDLNLLRVFDTLVEQRSVTRAADRLGLTQSAVSHALARLRDALGDPLFVRGSRGLHPTARALEIASGVREGLLRLDNALKTSQFEPSTTTRRFAIIATSYFLTHFMPRVVAHSRAVAPDISFQVYPLREDPTALLDQGIADIAVATPSLVRSFERLTTELLYEEELIWIAAHDSPLGAAPISLEEISTLPRVSLGVRQLNDELVLMDVYGNVKAVSQPHGDPKLPTRADAMIVYDSRGAIETVAQTDLVALVPRRTVALDIERKRVKRIPLTTAPVRIGLSMIWHSRQQSDAGLAWLRDLFHQAAT